MDRAIEILNPSPKVHGQLLLSFPNHEAGSLGVFPSLTLKLLRSSSNPYFHCRKDDKLTMIPEFVQDDRAKG